MDTNTFYVVRICYNNNDIAYTDFFFTTFNSIRYSRFYIFSLNFDVQSSIINDF